MEEMDEIYLQIPRGVLPRRIKYFEVGGYVPRAELYGPSGVAGVVPLLLLDPFGEWSISLEGEGAPANVTAAWVLIRKIELVPAGREYVEQATRCRFLPAVLENGNDVWVESAEGDSVTVFVRGAGAKPKREKVPLGAVCRNVFEYRNPRKSPVFRGPS